MKLDLPLARWTLLLSTEVPFVILYIQRVLALCAIYRHKCCIASSSACPRGSRKILSHVVNRATSVRTQYELERGLTVIALLHFPIVKILTVYRLSASGTRYKVSYHFTMATFDTLANFLLLKIVVDLVTLGTYGIYDLLITLFAVELADSFIYELILVHVNFPATFTYYQFE